MYITMDCAHYYDLTLDRNNELDADSADRVLNYTPYRKKSGMRLF